jgi:hypothetical protein
MNYRDEAAVYVKETLRDVKALAAAILK